MDAVLLKKMNEEMLAYLRTLANFGGTLDQSKELAARCIEKIHTMSESLDTK